MIRVEPDGEVTFFRLARGLAGHPLYWGGAYLFRDLMIDCGPPATAFELLRALEGRRVSGLVITHHHEDHMGAAPLLRARRGLVPRIHAAGVPLLREGFVQELYRRLAWGRAPRLEAEPLSSTAHPEGAVLQVMHTPGHSPDHVCFYEPERQWLFTGDLFLAERLRYLRSDEELSALIGSLESVGRLPLQRVFCGHRGPLRDGPAALRRKAAGLRELRQRVQELLGQGLDPAEVTRRAVGREGPLTWISLGRFSARNFVRAVARECPLHTPPRGPTASS